MRAVLLAIALAACGPKVAPPPPAADLDLEPRRVADVPPGDPLLAAERPVAPPGKGLRTGTIARDRLVAVLDAGPPSFLRQLEVTPKMSGDRFVGWELVQLVDRGSPLYDVDVVPGDVLLSVNGQPLSRPDQLQLVWDSLRGANALTAQLWRGDAKLELAFAIEPRL
jgi:type II secretory pathway component PulC